MYAFFVNFYKSAAGVLSGFCTPVMLLGCGAVLSLSIGISKILKPRVFFSALADTPKGSRSSPWKSVTMALAGTLGVGNITGVAAAMLQGGVGAVFWMWVGALFSMAVKYGEVALAVRYRQKDRDGHFFGGTMYVIRDGLGRGKLAGGFALLCMVNSLVTGNLVQSNAAADVLHPLPEWVSGIFLAALTVLALVYGIGKVGDITMRLIPGLTAVFMGLSLWIILGHLQWIPSILAQIVKEAFSLPAFCGGMGGLGIRAVLRQMTESGMGRGIRFGITRGIFSNEAGCGTSPTAHASADTKSPFHQGCWGIFEVICDTLVLCTMTALVICIGERRFGLLTAGGDNLTLRVFRALCGDFVYGLMGFMVALFAYGTILAQMYYGFTAIGYFSDRKIWRILYMTASLVCVFGGAVMESGAMWETADLVVCVMTCINTWVLWRMRREIRETVPDGLGKKRS